MSSVLMKSQGTTNFLSQIQFVISIIHDPSTDVSGHCLGFIAVVNSFLLTGVCGCTLVTHLEGHFAFVWFDLHIGQVMIKVLFFLHLPQGV